MAPTPTRRKSIAVSHQIKPSRPAHKRRPHSITPGDSVLKQLSPAARRRRSLTKVPRKSILKAALKLPTPDPTESPDDATQSMDFTRDLRAEVHDNTTRKSMSRRVSFASHAQVRLFQKQHKSNSSGSPPAPRTDDQENDYPRAREFRRRSSMRKSLAFSENGEASMDVDPEDDLNSSPLPAGFLDEGSAIMDEDFDEGDYVDDDDDMELTQAIASTSTGRRKSRRSIIPPGEDASRRISSVSRRPPLAEVPIPKRTEAEQDQDDIVQESFTSQDISQDMSQSSAADSSSEHTQPMEFTIPLNKSLRRPEPPSDALLRLAAMTHSGDMTFERDEDEDGDYDHGAGHVSTSTDADDMDLTDAQTRLLRARESLGLGGGDLSAEQDFQDDTFTSSEGDSAEMGDETVNVTNLWRQSLGGDVNSTMDLTGIDESHGDEANALPTPSPPVQLDQSEPVPPIQTSHFQSSVFRPPSAESSHPLQSSVFRPPSNPPQSNTFKPPVTDSSQPPPSPSRPVQTRPQPVFSRPGTSIAAPRPQSPAKGSPPVPASPRKGGTAAFAPPVARPQPGGNRSLPADREAEEQDRSAKQTAVPAPGARQLSVGGGLRRPSGYFAQRKSLGPTATPSDLPKPGSPKKKASLGLGRASVGSVSELNPELNVAFERKHGRAASPVTVEQAKDSSAEADRDTPRKSLASPLPMRPPPGYVPPPRSAAMQSPSRAMSARALEKQKQQPEEEVTTSTLDPVDQTEQWRAGVHPDSYSEEDNNEPPISIEQFFAMTGVRFMDELTAPRRSTIHPSQLQARRRSSLSDADIPLADYFAAMTVDVPQLELYLHVAKDLQAWIDHSKEIYRQAEEEAAKMTPTLFREYSQADEEVKEELLHQLKLIKSNNHATARSQWYDWRLQWVDQLQAVVDKGFSELQEDATTLEAVITETQGILPAMREEHARLMKELEEEQAIAAEIDNSDQDYLNELKNTIADQATALDAFRADVAETQTKHDRLQEKLDEIEAERKEASDVIEQSQRLMDIQKNSTEAEALRLKADLDALEQIHLWHTAKVTPQLFELVYASMFRVTVPCDKFVPIFPRIDITGTKDVPPRFRDQFPRFTEATMRIAEQRIRSTPVGFGMKHVAQSLGDFWSACNQLRSQLIFLSIKFPLTIEPVPTGNNQVAGLRARAIVLLDSLESKAFVYFMWDSDTLARWPMSIASMTYDVKVAYGDADPERLRKAVETRMAQATPYDHHACLLDACIEATLQYDQ